MDTGQNDYCFTLAAIADGTLSIYLSNGGGTLGTGAWKKVKPMVEDFVRDAAGYLGECQPASEFPLPGAGRAAFHIVRVGQVFSAQCNEDDLGNNKLPLSPLFHRAHELIATVRIVSEMRKNEAPLVFAVKMDEVESAAEQLEGGADPNMESTEGTPVTGIAVQSGAWEILRGLLAAGAHPDASFLAEPRSDSTTTLLSSAAGFKDPQGVRILLDAGANIDQQDGTGLSALHIASYLGNDQVTALLIERGANLELPEQQGYTPLMMAANAGQTASVRQLLAAGSHANAVDDDKSTPIMFAAQYGHGEIVRMLLEKNADPRVTGTHGMNAIDLAEQNGHSAVVRVLLGQS